MPFLKQQVEIVNTLLRQTALAEKRFNAGRFEALAVDVVRRENDKIDGFPAIMSENYEAQEITVNDTYPIIIYHKALNKQYKPNNFQAGNRDRFVVETVNIKMVVYAKYASVTMRQEQLEALITTNFPDQIPATYFAPLSLDNMTVVLQGSNLNSAAVWNEEYKNTELALAPEDIYFSINYQLQSNFRKGCFKICDCN